MPKRPTAEPDADADGDDQRDDATARFGKADRHDKQLQQHQRGRAGVAARLLAGRQCDRRRSGEGEQQGERVPVAERLLQAGITGRLVQVN